MLVDEVNGWCVVSAQPQPGWRHMPARLVHKEHHRLHLNSAVADDNLVQLVSPLSTTPQQRRRNNFNIAGGRTFYESRPVHYLRSCLLLLVTAHVKVCHLAYDINKPYG